MTKELLIEKLTNLMCGHFEYNASKSKKIAEEILDLLEHEDVLVPTYWRSNTYVLSEDLWID